MKILKIIGIILLVLIGLVLIGGLVAPKAKETERSTVIEAPPETVFNTVNDLRTWESWSPWKEMDPGMKVTMGNPAVGEGAYFTWTGDQAGSGKMSILASAPYESIETEVDFGWMGGAQSTWTFEPADEDTKVTWSISMRMSFPWNITFLFMSMEAINAEFDRGLELLKEHVEKEPEIFNGYEVQLVDLPERHFVAVREVVPMEKISTFFEENLQAIHQALEANEVEITGMPCGLYYSWEEEMQQTDMAGAIPVATSSTLKDLEAITLPAGKALLVEYYGDYHGIAAAHTAIDQYITAHNVKTGIPIIEQYATDPGQEPDTSKWLTRVFYPVEE